MSENNILAIITTKKLRDKVAGGAPIFLQIMRKK